jgi:methylthioribose-1-phosphate isomerase
MLRYDQEQGAMLVLDWQHYPYDTAYITCSDLDALVSATAPMAAPGKTPLTFAASYGLVLTARQYREWPTDAQRAALIQTAERLRELYPAAPCIYLVIDEALRAADTALVQGQPAELALATFLETRMRQNDAVAEACGRHAASLLSENTCILTHGFGGAAFNWMLHVAHAEQGKYVHVYVTETRPQLQGTRLTAQQVREAGAEVTLLTDNMPGLYFRRGMFDAYITAATHIAGDGSIANQAGTYQYAVLATHHSVPFYVLGYDGPEPSLTTAADLPTAQRISDEVLSFAGTRIAAEGVSAYALSCDVTPPELITSIITERGSFKPRQMADYHTLQRQNGHV